MLSCSVGALLDRDIFTMLCVIDINAIVTSNASFIFDKLGRFVPCCHEDVAKSKLAGLPSLVATDSTSALKLCLY